MPPKKKKHSTLANLSRKPVSPKKASAVKGGLKDKLATNHNQTLRSRVGR